MLSARHITRRFFGLFLAGPLLATTQSPFVITDNVELVLLDVSVKNRQGAYVTDLPQRSFQVFVDNKPQTISDFSRVDAPVTVGLIVDNSGSMRYKRPEVIMAGLAFAKSSNTSDEFFVVNFNNQVVPGLPPGLPFTDSLQILHNALFMGEPKGQTALYDAIAFGLKHLESAHWGKRTLIIVSDGGDNVSELKEAQVVSLIEQSRATVYTIGLVDPDDRDLRPDVLKKFAGISGGKYYQPDQLDDVMKVMYAISNDIRKRYTIGFSPQGLDKDKDAHMIKVRAMSDGQKLAVRTRTTFSTNYSTSLRETSLRDWR
jgi:Ca-activated chloride channel family protein